MAALDIATLGLAVDSRPVEKSIGSLDRFTDAGKRAERQADNFGKRVEDAGKRAAAANDNAARAAERASRAYDGYSRAAQMAARAVGAIVGAAVGKALIDFADTWSDINARVGLAIRNMDASGAVLDRLATVARRTYSALDLTAESFVRNASVLRELGKSTAEQLDYTESLNLALVVSGARGEHAARVQDALGKAMAAGKLRGDELNTVIERGGRVAEILAEELGVSQNQLRKLGSEGKITGDTIYNALTKRLEQLQEEAESMPATIGDGLMLIRNALFQTIGVFDQANGLSATFAEGLIAVADNIGRVVTYAATAVTAFGTYYVGAMVAAYVSTMTLNGALVLLRAALIRTGVGALIIGAGELVYQFGRLVSAAGGFGNAMGLLGDLASEVWERIKLDAHSAYLGVQAVWEKIKLGFLLGLSVMQKAWTNFLYFLADTAPTEGLSRTLTESAMKAGTEYLATERSIKGAREEIERLGAASDEAAAKARAPLESIAAIRKVLADAATGEIPNTPGVRSPVTPDVDKAAEKAKKAYKQIVDSAQEFIAAQRLEAEVLGMSEQAANALRYEQDLLNEARRAGINLTPEDIHGFKALAEAMAEAEERTRVLTERFEFMKDLTKGFFTDFKNDLISNMSQGMSFWESAWRAMASAAERAIGKVVDKLLDDLLNAIFEVNRAGSSGGGGGLFGFLGGLFGGVSPTSSLWRPNTTAGAFFTSGFSSGGYTGPGAASNPAGIVHAGEYVFSKQATDRLGVGYLDSLHNAAKGYMAGGLVSRIYAPANANLRGYQSGGLVRPSYESRSVNITIENHGTSKDFEVQQIGPDEVRIIARDEAAKVVQANNKLRQKRYQAGGQFG